MMPNSFRPTPKALAYSPRRLAIESFHWRRAESAFKGLARKALALLVFTAAPSALALLTAKAVAAQGSGPQDSSSDPSKPASATTRITYSRTLAGSLPEYLAVSVNSDGSSSYVGRRLDEPDHPRALRL